MRDCYLMVLKDGRLRLKHVLIAEKAIGHELPCGAIVHHADGTKKNNANRNLVICPDKAYHNLLHMRMRSVAAGFPAHFRRCEYCKHYDDPKNLRIRANGRALHIPCKTERKRLSRRRVAARRKATDPNFRGGHTFVP
jgi:hypothetical protein